MAMMRSRVVERRSGHLLVTLFALDKLQPTEVLEVLVQLRNGRAFVTAKVARSRLQAVTGDVILQLKKTEISAVVL